MKRGDAGFKLSKYEKKGTAITMNTRDVVNRNPFVVKYLGLQFNPDKYVFHLLLVLTLMFMILYTVGTSVPAWYVLEEQVTNVSTCRTADRYLEPRVRRYWSNDGPTHLLITSSLWFVNIRLTTEEVQYNKFVPFIFAQKEHIAEETRSGMYNENNNNILICLIVIKLRYSGILVW